MKLTKNFNLKEFTKSAGITIIPTDEQIFCIKTLCLNLLQPIRDKFGTVTISSGLRNKESNDMLIKQGYQASFTSDHLAWCTANPKGTGAADFYCKGISLPVVFQWAQDNLINNIGQIIYYPDKGFIHISNSWESIFKCPILVKKEKVLINKNGKFIPYKN